MKGVIIFGPPGVGKGTQSKLLSEKFNLRHISTGDIIRAEIKSGSDLGKRAADMIKGGNLLDDDTVIEITHEALKNLEGFDGYLLDGYPRTKTQAEAVVKFAENNNHNLQPLIHLTADVDTITERIKKRGIRAGESENVLEETLNRIRVYEKETLPAVDVFKRNIVVDSTKPVEEVFAKIVSMLEETN